MAAVSPTLLAVLTIGVGALILGVLIGMYTMPATLTPEVASKLAAVKRLTKNYYNAHDDTDPVYRALIDGPNPDSIKKNLNFLSIEPHQAGTQRDQLLAEFYRSQFLEYGLDRAFVVRYNVLLSYANITRPNKIYLTNKSTGTVVITQHQETPSRTDEMDANVPAYNGYSPKGDVKAEPVYCNYGRIEDFELLEDEARIDLKGKICIIRYGKIYRGNKVNNAARFGCSAVILYSDPTLVAPFDTKPDSVYPNSIWMNGKAMQRGNVRILSGDPLTPGFPSIIGGFKEDVTNEANVDLPKIPSQPIGYDDAKLILEQMAGINTKDSVKFRDWTGAMNITYRLGPGFMSENQDLRIVVNNELVQKEVLNVIGVLDGHLEKDRFVLVGNHRDSWSFGAMDASTGGVSMLETAKAFGQHHRNTGWRPRRSLVFASWAAEELGLIGSTEWVEEMRHLLSAQAVAYLNVDTCVSGPVLQSDASPSLMEVFREATKRVPSHKTNTSQHPHNPNQTLYDSWSQYTKHQNESKLTMDILSSGSDHVPFTYFAGVPSINIEFKHDKEKYPVSSYPAYHTSYETFYLVQRFIDPDFSIHQSCSRLIGILMYSLSCSTIVPVQLDEMAERIMAEYHNGPLPKQLRKLLPQQLDAIELLEKSIDDFANATSNWHQYLAKVNSTKQLKNDPYIVRHMNDVSMSVERVFADNARQSLHKRPDTRNILYGSPIQDFYQTVLFPGVYDLTNEIKIQQDLKIRSARLNADEFAKIEQNLFDLNLKLRHHVNEISLAFRVANKLLATDNSI